MLNFIGVFIDFPLIEFEFRMAKESRDLIAAANDRAEEAKEEVLIAREELEALKASKERDMISISNLQSCLEDANASKFKRNDG
jgi:hypothetical protein